MEDNNVLVKDLYKKFDGFILDHISFQVPKGRIVGFIGENGARNCRHSSSHCICSINIGECTGICKEEMKIFICVSFNY